MALWDVYGVATVSSPRDTVIATLLYNAGACFIQLTITVSGRECSSRGLWSLFASAALCACVFRRDSSIVYAVDGSRGDTYSLIGSDQGDRSLGMMADRSSHRYRTNARPMLGRFAGFDGIRGSCYRCGVSAMTDVANNIWSRPTWLVCRVWIIASAVRRKLASLGKWAPGLPVIARGCSRDPPNPITQRI